MRESIQSMAASSDRVRDTHTSRWSESGANDCADVLAHLANSLEPGTKARFGFYHSCTRHAASLAGDHPRPSLMTASEVLREVPASLAIDSVCVDVRHYDGDDVLVGIEPTVVTYRPDEFVEVNFSTSPDRLVREAVVTAPGAERAEKSEVRVEFMFSKLKIHPAENCP